MDVNKSSLIHIPIGSPFWAEPLMKNLYILEELAKNTEGGGEHGGDLSEVWVEVKKLQNKHNEDISQIEKEISNILKIIVGDTESVGLIEKVDINSSDIEKIYKLIDEMDSMTLDDVVKEIELITRPIEQSIRSIERNMSTTQEDVADIKKKESELRHRIISLEQIVEELKNGSEDFHHIVNTQQEMNAITQKSRGSLCFVRSEAQLFIWDGKWSSTSPESSVNKIQWRDIIDAPTAQPSEIDSTVRLTHTHSNKMALDMVTFSKINTWDSKADKAEIPTKLSDLENDIGAGGDYDVVIKEIQTHIGNMDELTTENKDSLVGALNEIHAKVTSVDDIHKELKDLKNRVVYLEK